MGKCIDKIAHACGGKRSLQVFEQDDGRIDGYCFRCNKFEDDPYKDKPEGYRPPERNAKDSEEDINEILEYPFVTLHDRKLNRQTLEYFGIRVGLSQSDGQTPTSHHYPYKKDGELRAFKNRIIEGKKMWTVGRMKDVDLFGWDLAIATGSNRLYITEGELDTAALWQMITRKQKGTEYEGNIPAVVSLTKGAANARNDIAKNMQKIKEHFTEVILVLDQDEAGEGATEDILKIAPSFKVAHLPCKDANQCLVEGKVKACLSAVMFKSSEQKNTRLVWGNSLHEAGRQEAQWGYSWPWDGLTELTRGIRPGETYYIGSGVKMG